MQIPILVRADVVAGANPGDLALELSLTLKDGTVLDTSPTTPAVVGGHVSFGPIMIPFLTDGVFGSSGAPTPMPAPATTFAASGARAATPTPAKR